MLLSALAVVQIVFPLTEGHLHHRPLWCFAMLATGLLAPGVHLRHQQNEWDHARSCPCPCPEAGSSPAARPRS